MIKFIKNFMVVIGIGLILNCMLYFLFVCYYYVAINRIDFSLQPEIDTVIVGNSMTECAIDDALLTGVLNWSQSGNSTGVTYYKLRKLLFSNNNIKYVIFNFGPYIYNENEQKTIFGIVQTFPLMTVHEFIDFSFPLSVYKLMAKSLVGKILSCKIECSVHSFGSYLNLNRNKLKEDIALHESRGLHINGSPSKYYANIYKLCKTRGVKLIFIQTPIYQKQCFYEDVTWIKNKHFSEVEYWDFSNLDMPNECYGDVIHLNRKGALLFTPKFNEKLEFLRDNNVQFTQNKVSPKL